jgi:hypothetical protein
MPVDSILVWPFKHFNGVVCQKSAKKMATQTGSGDYGIKVGEPAGTQLDSVHVDTLVNLNLYHLTCV